MGIQYTYERQMNMCIVHECECVVIVSIVRMSGWSERVNVYFLSDCTAQYIRKKRRKKQKAFVPHSISLYRRVVAEPEQEQHQHTCKNEVNTQTHFAAEKIALIFNDTLFFGFSIFARCLSIYTIQHTIIIKRCERICLGE